MILRITRRGYSRQALTLIELLVVVSIITLLSAITLPTLRTVMSQRKTSQGAMLVKNMLEAARARAIARGRPVAVVLERLSSRADRDPSNGKLIPTVASETDLASNYAAYNTVIRLSLAETPPPVEIKEIHFALAGNSLTLSGAGMSDARLSKLLAAGAEISFPDFPMIGRSLRVESYTGGSAIVDNYGPTPSLMIGQIDANVLKRTPIKPPVSSYSMATGMTTRMVIHPLPQPVASQVVDLPRGTCIDLSLSGFAKDYPQQVRMRGVQNYVNLRDVRRQFASDWISPQTNADVSSLPIYPTPEHLRPVYIVFDANGILESVLMNDVPINPGDSALNFERTNVPFPRRLFGPTGTANEFRVTMNKYSTIDDVYLFVGRTDQVIQITHDENDNNRVKTVDGMFSIDPATLENERIKANINDTSANWVRISPKSGSISVAPVAQFNEALQTSATAPQSIGTLLANSRSNSFTDEATAQ